MKMLKYFVITLVCSLVIEHLEGAIDVKKEVHEKYYKENDYNPHVVPVPSVNSTGLVKKPLKVQASVNIKNIFDVREKEQMVSMEMTLRLYWTDKRIRPNPRFYRAEDKLHGRYITLIPDLMVNKNDTFWMPDIFINEAKNIHSPTVHLKPSSLRVYEDGTIRSSTRINFEVFCGMEFRNYPFDVQACDVMFESFGYTKEIDFEWKHEDNDFNCSQINLHHFAFRPSRFETYDYLEEHCQGLLFGIKFFRKFEYLVGKIYIPSILFAVLDYFSLLIPMEVPMIRVMVGMTTLLSQITQFSNFRRSIPQVSYTTQLDVWMIFHITYITLCMMVPILLLAFDESFKWTKYRFHWLAVTEKIFKIFMLILYIVFQLWYWITNLKDKEYAEDDKSCSEQFVPSPEERHFVMR